MKNVLDQTIGLLNSVVGATANNLYNLLDSFFNRPIGLANIRGKNYNIMLAHLDRNIGNFTESSKNKIGTPIGMFADADYNNRVDNSPWFILDEEKQKYYDYLDYIDNNYYGGIKKLVNVNKNGIREFDFNDLYQEAAKPSVLRKLDNWQAPPISSNDYIAKSAINANNGGVGMDTRLGVISNYYLVNTLNASDDYHKFLGYSINQEPQDDMNQDASEKDKEKEGGWESKRSGASITKGVYSKFGIHSDFGMDGSSIVLGESINSPNSKFTGQIIPWSTSDHVYDSYVIHNDLKRVADIQSVGEDEVVLDFLDLAQDTTRSNLYSPFGNYYSITYSLGLISNSGAKTQKYIASSLLGYPLSSAVDASEILKNETIDITPYKKYYVGNGTRGTNYIDRINATVVDFVKYGGTTNNHIVRLSFPDVGNDNIWAANAIYQHIEAEGSKLGSPLTVKTNKWNSGVAHGTYKVYDNDVLKTRDDIIYKTNQLFASNKIKSIIGRFHTDEIGTATDARANTDMLSSAFSKYGYSRGRNLLKKDQRNAIKDGGGYSNPYCRVWTYHHEYATLNDTIRPFQNSLVGTAVSKYRTSGQQGNKSETWEDGQTRLEKLTARNKTNRLVKFAPTNNIAEEPLKDQLKHMMFSIENLAWKGCEDSLCKDQRGPLGGRIMWFPPYGLEFNEQTAVQWNETEFIGRGEKIPTYINTNRSGNLSFDILIDHPSVVNSYTFKGIGGEGIGDVDDVNSNEQTLLRFFAGCEVLDKNVSINPVVVPHKDPTPPKPIVIIEPEVKDHQIFSFFVFFPNNYSGVDDLNLNPVDTRNISNYDGATESNESYPLLYLLRGNGAQYGTYEGKTFSGSLTISNISGNGYEMINTPQENNTWEGISGKNTIRLPQDYLSANAFTNFTVQTYKTTQRSGKKTITVKREWAYRVDKEWAHQKLNKYNYVDNVSYGLNTASGYQKAVEAYNIPENERENYFAFTEVYTVFDLDDRGKEISEILSNECNPNKLEELRQIKEVLKNNKQVKNLKVTISGYASKHGYANANKKLSINRKNTIERWLKTKQGFTNATFVLEKATEANFQLNNDINSLNAKLGRAAQVTVSYDIEHITEPISNINIEDNKTEQRMRDAVKDYQETVNSLETPEEKTEYNKELLSEEVTTPEQLRVSTAIEAVQRDIDQKVEEEIAAGAATEEVVGYSNKKAKQARENGYGNEFAYFAELAKEDSFLHNKIVDKFKFFDPAFHSVTPEGFQARLTFLQQCTRQGSTTSWTDNTSIASAANLAFGKPPILVLRIGDFYNTKIAVTNLQIDYKTSNGISWDLNDEGIGIMPMYAHITMSFNFYGGSDLGGPISRLQNAVSFNYYANTGVYDNRAEMIEYKDDYSGEISKFKHFNITEK